MKFGIIVFQANTHRLTVMTEYGFQDGGHNIIYGEKSCHSGEWTCNVWPALSAPVGCILAILFTGCSIFVSVVYLYRSTLHAEDLAVYRLDLLVMVAARELVPFFVIIAMDKTLCNCYR